MKNNVFLFLLAAVLISSCSSEKPPIVLSTQIEYDVWIEGDPMQANWVNYVEGKNRHLLLELVFERLNAGQGTDLLGNTLISDSLYAGLSGFDSSLIVTKASVINMIEQGILPVKGFRFREKWTYSSETLELFKEVTGIAPLWCTNDSAGNWVGASPLFWVMTDSVEKESVENFQLLSEIIQYDVIIDNAIKPVVSMYGECPFYLFNIEKKDRVQYLSLLIDNIMSNKLKAYDYFFAVLPDADKQCLKGRKDTLVDIDEATGKTVTSVSDVPLPVEDLARIKFIEKWEISKSPFVFHKTVYALNPSLISYDGEGQFEGFKPLFWVFFNEEAYAKLIGMMRGGL